VACHYLRALSLQYYADNPDMLASFEIRMYRQQVVIRMRDLGTKQWLARWIAPF
jgi:hypothetical protein